MSGTRLQSGEWPRTRLESVLDVLRTIAINLLFTALVAVVGYSLLLTFKLKHEETLGKQREVESARAELQADIETNDALKHQIHFLKTSDGVEKVARERLGLIRPYESSFVVVNIPKTPAAHARPATSDAESGPSESVTEWVRNRVVELWNGGD